MWQGLIVEFARREGIYTLLRGVRALSDFEYEFELSMMNPHAGALATSRRCSPGFETIFLPMIDQRGLGYQPPKPTALREFLDRFHDPALEQLRSPREQQLSFIVPSSAPVQRLQQVQAGAVQRIAALYEQHGQRLSIATIDQDATIVESHKRAAFDHYQGGRGYQPMIALWAEADLIVADQFRDGNVPAHQEPLSCCQMAFAALPAVTTRYFRGDSACYENNLLDWLSSPERGSRVARFGGDIRSMVPEVVARALTEKLGPLTATITRALSAAHLDWDAVGTRSRGRGGRPDRTACALSAAHPEGASEPAPSVLQGGTAGACEAAAHPRVGRRPPVVAPGWPCSERPAACFWASRHQSALASCPGPLTLPCAVR